MNFFSEKLEKLKAMVDFLKTQPGVIITNFEIFPGASSEEINTALSAFYERTERMCGKGIEVPKEVIDFYKTCNGLSLSWTLEKCINGNYFGDAVGSINIIPVENVFGEYYAPLVEEDEEDEEYYFIDDIDMRRCAVFDDFANEACNIFIFHENGEYEMGYHYRGEETIPLNLDIAGFLDKILMTKGFWYWSSNDLQDSESFIASIKQSGMFKIIKDEGIEEDWEKILRGF